MKRASFLTVFLFLFLADVTLLTGCERAAAATAAVSGVAAAMQSDGVDYSRQPAAGSTTGSHNFRAH